MQNKTNKLIDKEFYPFDGVRRPIKLSNLKNVNLETLDWKSSGLKVVGISVLAFVLSFSLSSVGSTISYFNDVEKTIGNFLQADPLSFKVAIENENATSTSARVDISSGKASITPIMTPDADSEPIQYFVKTVVTGGDLNFCENLRVFSTWPFPYDGNLNSLVTSTSTSVGAWTLNLTLLDANTFSNKSCTIDLVYEGWNADAQYGKGYRDTKTISLTFFVPEIVPESSTIPEVVENAKSSSLETPPLEEEVPSEVKDTSLEDVVPPVETVVEPPPVDPPPVEDPPAETQTEIPSEQII